MPLRKGLNDGVWKRTQVIANNRQWSPKRPKFSGRGGRSTSHQKR